MTTAKKKAGTGAAPGDATRLSFWFPRELARVLKHRAVDEGRPMAALVTDAVRAYLKAPGKGGER